MTSEEEQARLTIMDVDQGGFFTGHGRVGREHQVCGEDLPQIPVHVPVQGTAKGLDRNETGQADGKIQNKKKSEPPGDPQFTYGHSHPEFHVSRPFSS